MPGKDPGGEKVELRRLAEKQLATKGGTGSIPETTDNQLRLFHEMQVHQIELELQNVALRQTREETACG
jgi:hypothetical protein